MTEYDKFQIAIKASERIIPILIKHELDTQDPMITKALIAAFQAGVEFTVEEMEIK